MKKLSETFLCCASLLLMACGGDGDSGSSGGGGSQGGGTLPDKGNSRTLAFPGADGCGTSSTTGGAGCNVYIVTNLNDSGDGSLRFGLKNGNKTIVFAVGGQINLKSQLDIAAPNITIAGQTAPGGGITIAGYPIKITSAAKNIILRYLRFRMGDQNVDQPNFSADAGDALEAKDCSNILIDHCSISYSTDECASFSRVTNVTVQYCIISESMKLAGHSKGNHGYGGIWGGKSTSYHHNLLAHHDSRNPRFDHNYVGHATHYGPIDYVNNVVYNWGGNSAYGGEAASIDYLFHINMVNNYYKPGNTSKHQDRLLELTSQCENCYNWGVKQGKTVRATKPECYVGKYFIAGNFVNGTANKDWNGVDAYADSRTVETIKEQAKLTSRHSTDLTALNFTESAENAYNTVLEYAGASKTRDAVDIRIVSEVQTKGGAIIDKVSGDLDKYFPHRNQTWQQSFVDSDRDGMPDEWERTQIKALGASADITAFSPSAYNITSKYTNLEVYMNELVAATFPAGAGANKTR